MKDLVFYGEEGVHRRWPLYTNAVGFLDADYDRFNPDGSTYGRRNYRGSCYQSGMGDRSPGEYPTSSSKG